MNKLWMAVVAASGCAMTDGAGDELGDTEQAISSTWQAFSWGTQHDLVGVDIGWPAATTTCVMSAVLGDLGEGGRADVADVASYAAVKVASNGHYFLVAHGGAYTNQTNDRVWADNKVKVGAVCVPYPRALEGSYKSSGFPKFLGPSASGRRCFLNSIEGGGQIFTHDDDFVLVKQHSSTDATHPLAGWYVEGNLTTNPHTGQPAFATAFCIDFPSIAQEWATSTSGATEIVTTGDGVKMCGVTGVRGAFDINSYGNGVEVDPPSAKNGNWAVTVSTGKTASMRCVQ